MDALTELFSLRGKTALITGATRGIGQSMAVALAEAGADIILVQRDEKNKQTYEKIASLGRRVTIYTAELGDSKAVEGIVPNLVKQGHSMDILVNCAGIQRRHPSEKFPMEDWNEVIQVNLSTVFTLCRDFGAHLLTKPDSRDRGAIINIGSLLSFQGGITVPAYAASKGGVAQMTKTFSNEWSSKGIRVNAIAPGYIGTDMNEALIANEARARQILERIPSGRWGSPDDFKGPIIWLASGKASGYVTGEIVTVDGGWMGR
ncbi:putative 2-deoxy-d-gluconate 3-dehydrogenase [Phaeomoniella chlamydospora]|uniref:Putative 2-deoxy-d-gluconate 3-dehydrogenase n=1 Tax=Phaeomoniella chlamydospora TaxID=158046 RepID=A0A0G2DYK4_PHACM|nr:putative 2-deoxy-d-gluconate 3-dehydrogenase [Phaeomoniella chlamydospora]